LVERKKLAHRGERSFASKKRRKDVWGKSSENEEKHVRKQLRLDRGGRINNRGWKVLRERGDVYGPVVGMEHGVSALGKEGVQHRKKENCEENGKKI